METTDLAVNITLSGQRLEPRTLQIRDDSAKHSTSKILITSTNSISMKITLEYLFMHVRIGTRRLRARIAEPKKMSISRQQLRKHVTTATNTHATNKVVESCVSDAVRAEAI
jgi:hypothetical protein